MELLRLQSQLCRPAVGGRTCGPGPSTQARHSPDHRSRGGAWGRYPTLPTDLANGNAAQRKITQKQAHVRTLAWRAAKATCNLSLISDHGPHTHTCPARPAEGRAHAGMTWSPLPWAPGQKRAEPTWEGPVLPALTPPSQSPAPAAKDHGLLSQPCPRTGHQPHLPRPCWTGRMVPAPSHRTRAHRMGSVHDRASPLKPSVHDGIRT